MGDVFLIVTTGTNGHIVAPYVSESKVVVESLVEILSEVHPKIRVEWPTENEPDHREDDVSVVTFDATYLDRDCIVKRVYEVQVERDLMSLDEFMIDPQKYRITHIQSTLDNGPRITVWDRIEEEIEVMF